jgi:outer membrane protein TolC
MMTISGRRQIHTLTFVLALVAHPAIAQDAADRVRFERIAREAAQKVDLARADAAAQAQTGQAGQPGAPLPQAAAGPVVELPLDDAVQRALERNLDISVERLDPQSFDFTIAALDANYRPTFNSSFGLRSQSQFPRSQTAGADMLVTDTLTGNAGLSQNLKWGGGSFAVSFNNNRQEQSDAFATRNPAINTNLTATFVQPLLRSFRIDGTRAQLQITRLNQQISEIALRSTIVRTLAEVRSAYWDLIFAIDAVKVAQGSLDLATKLVDDNRARVEVGTLAKLDVVQAQAEEATRRQALTQAIANRRTAELQLKRLIVSGTDDPYWSATLEPVERPSYSTQPVDVAQAIRTALGTRTDLEQARRQISANDVALRSWTDQQLPALDLTASYGLAGVGGTQFIRQGGALGGQISSTIPSGYSDALSILARQDAPTWNVNLNFSFPIGASPAEANVARARLQQRQTLAQTKQLELQIATEVSNAATQVDYGLARLDAANVALDLMQQRLEYEQSRYDVGLSTNYQVVQAQRDLRDAQNAQLRALLDYRQAQVDFERVQQIPLAGGGAITAIGASGSQPPRAGTGGGF